MDENLGSPAETANLVTLYYMNHGPDCPDARQPAPAVSAGAAAAARREPLSGRRHQGRDRRVPRGTPDAREDILGARTVVRRADAASLKKDIAALKSHPLIDGCIPG
jgi:hypothetical protein